MTSGRSIFSVLRILFLSFCISLPKPRSSHCLLDSEAPLQECFRCIPAMRVTLRPSCSSAIVFLRL